MRKWKSPSLHLILTGCFAFSVTSVGFLITLIGSMWASDRAREEIGHQLGQLAYQVSYDLDRAMFERYREIQMLADAELLDTLYSEPDRLRKFLERLQSTYAHYAWIGFADPEGQISASTGGLLEGESVAQRPWFSGALDGPFAGDLHPALLLEQLLDGDSNEPMRFVDVAAPVVDARGHLLGVLGAHLNWNWARELTDDLLGVIKQQRAIELFITDSQGAVLLAPTHPEAGPIPEHLELDNIAVAHQGQHGDTLQTWPSGEVYLTGFAASQGYQNYPGLGWITLVRQQPADAFQLIGTVKQAILWIATGIAVVFAVLGWCLSQRITHPLSVITASAEKILNDNARPQMPQVGGYREAHVLSRTLDRLLINLATRDTLIAHQQHHDDLTELPNRVAFFKRTARILEAPDEGTRFAVLLLDLDGFTQVNDLYGHQIGDRMLREVAHRMTHSIPDVRLSARYYGDQFIMLVANDQSNIDDTIAHTVDRVQVEITRPFHLDDSEIVLSASIGISLFLQDADDAQTLLAHAHAALFRAKGHGPGSVEYYDAASHGLLRERFVLIRQLRQTVQHGGLSVHYQAQADVANGRVIGYEALLRWQRANGDWVSPAVFIPIAEANGLIGEIGDWVLEKACRQAVAWHQDGRPGICMSVNVSGHQLRQDFPDRVRQILQRTGLPARQLELEITETVLLQDPEHTLSVLNRLRSLGVTISIDDFGTGYSSLSQLKNLPVDYLKIDRSFIRDLLVDHKDLEIVRAIMKVAVSMNLQITAEGVEEPGQLEILRELGCHRYQGYHLARPLPAEQAAAFFDESSDQSQSGHPAVEQRRLIDAIL